MSDTKKPPFAIWLGQRLVEMDKNSIAPVQISQHKGILKHGPYVHLISLFEQVEKESFKISQKWNINPIEARGEAFKNIVRNILIETEQT